MKVKFKSEVQVLCPGAYGHDIELHVYDGERDFFGTFVVLTKTQARNLSTLLAKASVKAKRVA